LALTSEFLVIFKEKIPVIHAVNNGLSAVLKLVSNLNSVSNGWSSKSTEIKAVSVIRLPVEELISPSKIECWEVKSNLILVKFSQEEVGVEIHALSTHEIILYQGVCSNKTNWSLLIDSCWFHLPLNIHGSPEAELIVLIFEKTPVS